MVSYDEWIKWHSRKLKLDSIFKFQFLSTILGIFLHTNLTLVWILKIENGFNFQFSFWSHNEITWLECYFHLVAKLKLHWTNCTLTVCTYLKKPRAIKDAWLKRWYSWLSYHGTFIIVTSTKDRYTVHSCMKGTDKQFHVIVHNVCTRHLLTMC